MKKKIPFIVLALTLWLAVDAAQPRHNQVAPAVQVVNAKIEHRTAQRHDGQCAATSPRKQVPANSAYYLRPKGTMYAAWLKNGSGYMMPFIHTKPYDAVTWRNMSTAQGTSHWSYTLVDPETGQEETFESSDNDLSVKYGYECVQVPTLTVGDYPPYALGIDNNPASVAAVVDSREVYTGASSNFLASAHYYGNSDRFGKQSYGWIYYTGAMGSDGEGDKSGYWFGKNYSGYNVFGAGFDAPVSPYVLNKVYLFCANLVVAENVDLGVKIYRYMRDDLHKELPQYSDTEPVFINAYNLTDNNLIASGRTTITPEMAEDGDGILEFTLYETDEATGVEREWQPEINDAIIVVVTGMDQAAIQSITGLITTDAEDEGVGELTYIGRQADGYIELYGLNNFFANQDGNMPLKVGASILLDVSRPFLVFNIPTEKGEYTFPAEGGSMTRTMGGQTFEGISFYTAQPSAEWTVTMSKGGSLPEWLHITLTDDMDENGDWTGTVTAHVTADPRNSTEVHEAQVRFAFKGAYIDYLFSQAGYVHPSTPGDADGNHIIDIDDVNIIINIILQKKSLQDYPGADTDDNGNVDVDDLNNVINMILG